MDIGDLWTNMKKGMQTERYYEGVSQDGRVEHTYTSILGFQHFQADGLSSNFLYGVAAPLALQQKLTLSTKVKRRR